MPKYVVISAMILASPSSNYAATAPSMVLFVSSLTMGLWDRSSKLSLSSVCSLMVASSSTRLTTDAGMVTTRNCLRVMRFPVVIQMNMYLSCKSEVGPRQIALHVHSSSMFFDGWCSSCTLQYSPDLALKCFFQSNDVPVMMVCGLNVADTLLFAGNMLSHMTKKFISSMIIRLGVHL